MFIYCMYGMQHRLVVGEPILYAPKSEKKPITPVKPITIRIRNDE